MLLHGETLGVASFASSLRPSARTAFGEALASVANEGGFLPNALGSSMVIEKAFITSALLVHAAAFASSAGALGPAILALGAHLVVVITLRTLVLEVRT